MRLTTRGLAAALLLVGACSGAKEQADDERDPLEGTTTTVAPSPSARSAAPEGWRCTSEDEAAFEAVLEERVLAEVSPARRAIASCSRGEWTWATEGMPSTAAADPALLDAIDARLGDLVVERADRIGADTTWFVRCSPTLPCRIDVSAVPGGDRAPSLVDVRATAQHVDEPAEPALTGPELAAQGIVGIAAAPVSDYCADAIATISGAGTAGAPTSFLSTRRATGRGCATVPLALDLARPQQVVAIEFWGAASPYELRAFDAEGRLVGTTTAQASPYEYERAFRAEVRAGAPVITRVTFGYETAITQVTAITFGVTSADEHTVRFDAY